MEYRINFINNSFRRFAKTHKEELIGAFWDCLERGALILREEVSRLEDNIAKFVGTKYAIGVNSGTDALLLSLKSIGIKQGNEVITTPFTFISPAEMIAQCGAKPVFVDINYDDFLINPDLIEKAITKNTKAIL